VLLPTADVPESSHISKPASVPACAHTATSVAEQSPELEPYFPKTFKSSRCSAALCECTLPSELRWTLPDPWCKQAGCQICDAL